MNIEESNPISRRGFLKVTIVGAAALALPMTLRAQNNEPPETFRIQSGESRLTPWTHHRHFLDVPMAALENPPEDGIELSTTKTLFHTHKVPLTREHLLAIAAGEIVTVEDTVGDHIYEISFHA
jgi:hypothetical protein